MDDILKIVTSLEDSGILLKSVSETIQNEAEEQRRGFLGMLLGTLGASLLGDLLAKNLLGKGTIRAGEGASRAGYGSKKSSLKKIDSTMNSSPRGRTTSLTNFEIEVYYQNEPRFNGVFSRDNLPNTIKNGAYVINLDEYHDNTTNTTVTYFDSLIIQ